MEIKRVALVLADISGYTRFMKLHTVSLLHAEVIITDLLEAVLNRTEFPLTLSKLEGDAAFLYLSLNEGADARAVTQDVLRQVTAFMEAFKTRERELIACNICTCEACQTIGQLKLKAFLHVGQVAITQIRQFEELAGEDVILIHRLMKNSIPAKEYVMMTEVFYELSGGLAGQTPETRTEECEGIGPTLVRVYYPIGGEPPLPPRPSPSSTPSPEYKALHKRFDAHMARRVQSRESPPHFAHLPNARFTPFDWLKVIGEIVVGMMVELPKLQRERQSRKP